MAEFTERQLRDWPGAIAEAQRFVTSSTISAHLSDIAWSVTWQDESRPGRGHGFNGVWCDGEFLVQITMDVYGEPKVSVASVDWLHSSNFEEGCPCRHTELPDDDDGACCKLHPEQPTDADAVESVPVAAPPAAGVEAMYAAAVNLAAERSPFGHPLPNAEVRAARAGVDAAVARQGLHVTVDELRIAIKEAIGYGPVRVSLEPGVGGLTHRSVQDRDWLVDTITTTLAELRAVSAKGGE